jgi:hypothetical protein
VTAAGEQGLQGAFGLEPASLELLPAAAAA